ncbi:MAG: CotH kinase family protein, partial [Sedimentisphaerales bacterium]|nr:CotH kinase family protein [Sedimentisphaerales bacterium]
MREKFFFVCIVVIYVWAQSAYGGDLWDAAVMADDPLHWYRFDETSGDSCIDHGSASLIGTYSSVALAQEGLLGSATAVEFLGSSLVTFGSVSPISFDWTAEYIVMKKASASQALHDDGISSLRVQGWSMQEASFTLYGVADYQFTKQPGREAIVPLNEWKHLVFRCNGMGTQLFINGELAGTHASSVNLPLATLGGRAGTSADAFYGLLDEAVVYNRALTDEQIRFHAEACMGNPLVLVPDNFETYTETADLLMFWSSIGQLYLETYDTNQGAGAMKAILPALGVVSKDMNEVFDYSIHDGQDLVVRIKGAPENIQGDVTLIVLDRDENIIESFTLPDATLLTEWAIMGVPVDVAAKPGWSQVGKIQIKVGSAATLLIDDLTFQTRHQGITGDLNGDGNVDLADLLLFSGQWLNATCFGLDCADLNRIDGVGMADLAILAENWKYKSDLVEISEFMAVNSYVPFLNSTDIHTTVNGIAEHADWIELHNTSMDNGVSLEGWYLTDDPENLTKWKFSDVFIPADGYLVVYASGKTADEYPDNFPYVDDAGNLHTNFELSGDGEYLALVWSDGVTIVHQYAPQYPPQRGLISYGTGNNGLRGYLKTPTPKAPNSTAWAGAVADTKFSVNRGFYEAGQSFDVRIQCETEGAVIHYTLDGSTPTLSNGDTYTIPIFIASTTCLRAVAFKEGWLSTNVDTHTYIFLDDVIRQSPSGETPSGWPTGSVNGQTFEYGMDPDIVDSEEYSSLMIDVMKAIPSISLVTDLEYLVDPMSGIYVNATREGVQWERPTSVELIDAKGDEGFQTDAGLRIRGGYSRSGTNPKHSFRLLFKGGYGRGKLEYPLFGDERADEFDDLDLRTAQNYAWSNWGNDGSRNTFIRDVYSRDLQREMNQPYTASRYYHLYINGQYWGLYQSQERSEASYAERYFGDDKQKYDVVKADNYSTGYTDGTLDKWNELWWMCEAGFDTDETYYAVQGKNPIGENDPALEVHVDVDNLIDYMIDIFFTGNRDAPVTLSGTAANNFFAIRNRDPRIRQGWQFFAYDSEHSMLSTDDNRTTWVSAGSAIEHFNPQWLHQKLTVHPEYRMHFADQVHKYFFNDGVLTPDRAKALCLQRAAEIDLAIIGESARWGDHRSDRVDSPYTRAHWWAEVKDYLVDTFLSVRTDIVLDQLKAAQLYPQVEAPQFRIGGILQHGGYTPVSATFSMTVPDTSVYTDVVLVPEGAS